MSVSALSENWTHTYVSLIRYIGGKSVQDPEAKKAYRVLKTLAREAYIKGRGEVYLPKPRGGVYPEVEISYPLVNRAIRKNTGKVLRQQTWDAVAREASYKPSLPPPPVVRESGSLSPLQRRKLLEHAVLALPREKGRYPHLLGKRVPGQARSDRNRSYLTLDEVDPADWASGFGIKRFNKRNNPMHYKSNSKCTFERHQQYGLAEGLRDLKWRTKQAWQALTDPVKESLPTATRAATMSVLRDMHTMVGLPGITEVDGIPIQRRGLKPQFAPFANIQLMALRSKLKQQLQTASEELVRRGLANEIANIEVELASRRKFS